MKIYLLLLILVITNTLAIGQTSQKPSVNRLSIDVARPGAEISPAMYGIFFEEINHSGDGGLYAEMISNRGFEDRTLPSGCTLVNGFLTPPAKPNYLTGRVAGWKTPWDTINKWPGWSLRLSGNTRAGMKLVTETPLNEATPHSMQVFIRKASKLGAAELINEGYWGVAVKKKESYNLRFYLRVKTGYTGSVTARIVTDDGKLLAKQNFKIKSQGNWNEYTGKLTASATSNDANFALSFDSVGTVWVDYVSLFPEKTFKNRSNGLRNDVAQKLANLSPAFVRWPGGCIAEGLTLDNRVKWKETLGDPMTRPGMYDVWGYRNSCGFGYHEYLQFCEDIGAAAMFVCNAGMSCAVRNGDYCADDEVPAYLNDALDAIEYALGDSSSVWGKVRAKAGHPSPFPLRYIEVGNENSGPIYAQRFDIFYRAIKARYPQLTIISTLSFGNETKLLAKTDLIDPHYYQDPQWFYHHTELFDSLRPRPSYPAYIGEYACNQGVGNGNFDAALSEAAFMTGMERNADLVRMCSYAPLIENSNARNWPVNLLWLKNDQCFGRSSYYIQQMFSQNRPDVNLPTRVELTGTDIPKKPFKGFVGLGTWLTSAIFKDITITPAKGDAYRADFTNNQNEWNPISGRWRIEDGNYIQGELGTRRISRLQNKVFTSCTIELKAKKAKGDEGFLVVFSGDDDDHYYQINIGGYGNKSVVVEKVIGGIARMVSPAIPYNVETNRWYNIRVTVAGDEVSCSIDGKEIVRYKIQELEKRYAVAGLDRTHNEIIVKVVNAEPEAYNTIIDLAGAGSINPIGDIVTLTSASNRNENTFKAPLRIAPKASKYKSFASKFSMKFEPYSCTILRIKQN